MMSRLLTIIRVFLSDVFGIIHEFKLEFGSKKQLTLTTFFLDSSSDESSSSASTSDSDHIIGARGKNKFIKGKTFKIVTKVLLLV